MGGHALAMAHNPCLITIRKDRMFLIYVFLWAIGILSVSWSPCVYIANVVQNVCALLYVVLCLLSGWCYSITLQAMGTPGMFQIACPYHRCDSYLNDAWVPGCGSNIKYYFQIYYSHFLSKSQLLRHCIMHACLL